MKNNRIQVHFERKNNIVYGYVINTPEKLRGKYCIISKDMYELHSENCCELSDGTDLYLQGCNKNLDDTWFCYQYDSTKEAKEAIKKFEQLINEWNDKNNPILDDVEKKYLKGVITPFRDRVTYLKKTSTPTDKDFQYIEIVLKSQSTFIGEEYIELPLFKSNTIYLNMELGKEYTLNELGI